jgi:hypothetical protein
VVRFKNWEIDVFVEFRRQNGQNPYAILYHYYMPGFSTPYLEDNAPVEFLHRWRQPGDHAALQKMTESAGEAYQRMQDYIASTANSIDASFIRLKNVGVTYRLKNYKIWIKTENLFTWTRFPVSDPETQDPRVLPPVRTVAMGMQVNF